MRIKSTLFIVLICAVTACGTSKMNDDSKSSKIEKRNVKKVNFTISKPVTWRKLNSHGYVNYTPLPEGENFQNNKVAILSIKMNKSSTLDDFANNFIKQSRSVRSIVQESVETQENQLGTVYIHAYESKYGIYNYRYYTMYFLHNENYYIITYSSLKELYEKYLKEALSIFESIKLN